MHAQLAFASITLAGYVAGYASAGIAWLTSRKKANRQKGPAVKQKTGLIDWQTLELCKQFTLQVSPLLKLCLLSQSGSIWVLHIQPRDLPNIPRQSKKELMRQWQQAVSLSTPGRCLNIVPVDLLLSDGMPLTTCTQDRVRS